MAAKLMPPPPGTTAVPPARGGRRQRALGGQQGESGGASEREALVAKRLQEAIIYSEVVLPTIYGHGSAEPCSQSEEERAVLSSDARACLLRVTSAASAASAATQVRMLLRLSPEPSGTTPMRTASTIAA